MPCAVLFSLLGQRGMFDSYRPDWLQEVPYVVDTAAHDVLSVVQQEGAIGCPRIGVSTIRGSTLAGITLRFPAGGFSCPVGCPPQYSQCRCSGFQWSAKRALTTLERSLADTSTWSHWPMKRKNSWYYADLRTPHWGVESCLRFLCQSDEVPLRSGGHPLLHDQQQDPHLEPHVCGRSEWPLNSGIIGNVRFFSYLCQWLYWHMFEFLLKNFTESIFQAFLPMKAANCLADCTGLIFGRGKNQP